MIKIINPILKRILSQSGVVRRLHFTVSDVGEKIKQIEK